MWWRRDRAPTPAGTPGVVFLMDFCGECRSCRLGLTNQCLAKRADMGFNQDGGYGPYELVHENIFFPVDADIPLTDATLLLDIMGTNGHAIRRARLVHPDPQSLLVTGAGPIGLGMAAMAKLAFGADFPVAIADIVPWRLQLAEKLGALPIDLNRQSLPEGLRRHGLEALDLAMDTNLIETQCHAFDQLEWLCGPIDRVMAEMTDKTGGGFRTLVLALHFANGAVGSLIGTYDSSYAYTDTHRLEINGTRGRVVVEDTVRRYTFQAAGSETAEVWEAGYFNDWDREFHRTFDRHVDDLLRAFRRGEPPPIPAEAGRRALVLAYAAIESYQSGQRVSVAAVETSAAP